MMGGVLLRLSAEMRLFGRDERVALLNPNRDEWDARTGEGFNTAPVLLWLVGA